MKTKRFFAAVVLGWALVAGLALTLGVLSESVRAQTPLEASGVYATQTSPGWCIRIIDSGGDADSHLSSLALENADTPHVAYHVAASDSLKYAVLSGTVWLRQTIETGGLAPSLVLDSAATPHVAYTHRHPVVVHATWNGSTWITDALEAPPTVTAGVSLVLDSEEDLHAAYWNVAPTFNGGGFKYAYHTGTDWQAERIEELWTPAANSPSLALDSSDQPRIAYVISDESVLRYAALNDAAWVTETVAFSATTAWLALDGNDQPHIAYTHEGPFVRYAFWNGTRWVTETIDVEMGAYPSLVLDDAGNPHVAYCDARPVPPGGSGEGLKYAYRNGDAWVIESVDPIECSEPSLALDDEGNPHITYYDATHDQFRYARGGVWQIYLPVVLANYD